MTRPLQRILAATDGSPSGRLAVVRAASIARETGAALHAVHVTAPEEPATDEDHGGVDLRHHLARINPRAEVHHVQGTTFVEIIRLGRALEAGLIVTGAHSGPAARRFFLGTTAGRLARHGDRPLLLVRQPVRGPYRRVLLGIDTSPACADVIAAARAVAPGAALLPAMIHHVIGEAKVRAVGDDAAIAALRSRATEDRRRDLQAFLTAHADAVELAGVTSIVEIGNPSERLPELPREYRCDLIAIGTHGRTKLSYALLGSVAEHVLRDSDGDVLLARHGPTRLHPT